jgi:pyruvate oxidase
MQDEQTTTVNLTWHKVAEHGDLPEGRVKTVNIETGSKIKFICLTHHEGQYGALDNHCPHQGGPLGEGSIENGYLRCPWHGWDYCPLTGKPPGGYDDGVETYPIEVREDGVYVGLEGESPHVRTVTDVMAETMTEWGITHVFGMVGHSNLGLADALRRQEAAGRLTYIGIRHEGAASFAASAFAKLTGDPAACFAIAGPGATNLLTGLWDAKVDRAPILALTGQVQTQVFGPGAFQELPLTQAFESVAKFSHLCLPNSDHAELMNLALKTAKIHRDVAHIIFPDDVQELPAKEGARAGTPDGRIAPPQIAPPEQSIDEAVKLITSTDRPVIIVGHGARFEMEPIIALAERLECPVLTTFKGKGLIPDDHPCAAGVLGRSGTPVASWFMNESGCLLVFGASFSNHTGITPKRPTVQVDFDRMQLSKFHKVDVPVWGEIGVTCRILAERLAGHGTVDQRPEIADRRAIWRAEKQSRLADDQGRGVSSIAIFDSMNRVVPDDAIIAVDVGNNTYSFGRYFECRGQAVLMSGYLGSIGFGYPAAIGAWCATQVPDRWEGRFHQRPVVCITGDGGFGQYAWEVNTAVKYGMNISHILLNNNELGKISKEQRSGDFPVWQTSLTNPNIAEYVTGCGGLGIRVTAREELDDAIERALAYPGPATVEVITDPDLV